MIRALIEKDLKLYFRNRFFLVVTLLGLVAFIALYYLMPSKPDDTITTAIVLPENATSEMKAFLSDAMDSNLLSSKEELLKAVENGDYQAGTVLDETALAAIEQGKAVTITVYSAPGATKDMNTLLAALKAGGLLFMAPAILDMVPKAPDWIARIFPTYYILNPVMEVAERGAGLNAILGNLLVLAAIAGLLIFGLALVIERQQKRLALF